MFRKWELVEAGVGMICEYFNAFYGYSCPKMVIVDVYRKKRLDGTYKYKNIIR